MCGGLGLVSTLGFPGAGAWGGNRYDWVGTGEILFEILPPAAWCFFRVWGGVTWAIENWERDGLGDTCFWER